MDLCRREEKPEADLDMQLKEKPECCLRGATEDVQIESCSLLMVKLSAVPAIRYYTDDWRSYRKYIPPSEHIAGKADTWRIERRNLNFRTHIKRLNRETICFSKNEKIQDNVIGMAYQRLLFPERKRSILGKYLINGLA